MRELRVRVGDQTLAVVDEGPQDGEPLLLIMGLGLQLTAWPQGLIDRWTARGFRVLRYDHRDIGLSSAQDHLQTPPLLWSALKHALHLPLQAPYRLQDLADDAAGLLRQLGIERAQVVGVSMGGMVAQHLARRHPALVSHLHLWMTSSGARRLPLPSPELRRLMLQRPRSRLQALEHYTRLYRALAGPAYPTPEAELRAKVEASAARAWRPQATLRQLLAIAADGDRSRWLRELSPPVSVLHGSHDPMLPLPHGRQLAACLPAGRCRFEVIDGWGHDLPAALWKRLSESVQTLASNL
ncbi:alpha/beta fold hydrolase [Inhella sp.]|uniref:alpha/beta fold hydrolase n=1 Tax=Inhella sp. TaxID=1921806 RepID=UPI0035AEC098